MARIALALVALALFAGIAQACDCVCGGGAGILNGNDVDAPVSVGFSEICGNTVNVLDVPVPVLNQIATACGKGTVKNNGLAGSLGGRKLMGNGQPSCECGDFCSLADEVVGAGGIGNGNDVDVPVDVSFKEICGNNVAVLAVPVTVANAIGTACGNGKVRNGPKLDSKNFLTGLLGGLLNVG